MMENGKANGQEVKAQQITMPSGGGAIRSIGESFETDEFKGTAGLSFPVPVSKARQSEPSLTLNYNSGDGNSTFGLGFSLDSGRIYRRTDTGVPTYTPDDRFVFSREGQLTPKLVVQDDRWVNDSQPVTLDGVDYDVLAFLPRTQKSYALIEQFTQQDNGLIWWRVTSVENVVSVYGMSANARISDPEDATKVSDWLLESSIDDKGNITKYNYKAEDGDGLNNNICNLDRSVSAQKYLHSIQYGNYRTDDALDSQTFAFEVVFDYGEYNLDDLDTPNSDPYSPVRPWPVRSDPYSSYRTGFEIRTLRLCRNIMMFHHFAELGDKPCLVKAMRLDFDQTTLFSFVKSVYKSGYRIQADSSYASLDSPKYDLHYSEFSPDSTPKFDPLKIQGSEHGYSVPDYLNSTGFLPVKLNSESLPGLFFGDSKTALYCEPLGNGCYQTAQLESPLPLNHNLQNPSLTLKSLDANGQMSFVVESKDKSGFYDHGDEGQWENYQTFEGLPTALFQSASENVDLEGNGKQGLALFQKPNVSYYPSAGKAGYEEALFRRLPDDFPSAVNNGATELVTFANIFGDGLSHRVRVRDGSVEVWPSLGRGLFADKVLFDCAPHFKESMNSARIHLADIDGSGLADLILVYRDRIEAFMNQSGNSFSKTPLVIELPGGYTDMDQIQFMDILGNGTSALVLTNGEPKLKHLFYNFCGSRVDDNYEPINALKPYLVVKTCNNLGASNEIFYASSTEFFLADKANGRPWATHLPFPIQVVKKTISRDLISGSRFSKQYAYHEGYYDFTEKSFRGFGYIESWDSESFEDYEKPITQSVPNYSLQSQVRHVPPKYTKSWYHVGAFYDRKVVSNQYQSMYYSGDSAAYDFPDSVISPEVWASDAQTIRQAYAALAGKLIRQETYSDDGSPLESNPYTVTQANVDVTMVQPKGYQRYAVFTVNPRERITYNYERVANDPRVIQEFTLEIDESSGKTKKDCTVYLPRRANIPGRQPEQSSVRSTATYNDFANTASSSSYRQRGVPTEVQEFEILGLDLNGASYFNYQDILPVAAAVSAPIPYKSKGDGSLQARQLTWRQMIYWNENQSEPLANGQIANPLLLHSEKTAEFPQAYIDDLLGPQLTSETIDSQGGYTFEQDNGYWWNYGLTQFYTGKNEYYLPNKTANSQANGASSVFSKTVVEYDKPYQLNVVKATQFLDNEENQKNVVSAEIDFITMSPFQQVDINENVTQVLFDALGQVIVKSTFGIKDGELEGGMLLYPYAQQPAEYQPRSDPSFASVLNKSEFYLQGASHYFYYDLHGWENQQPACSIDLIRADYYHVDASTTPFTCKTIINFNDGFARELENKVKTSPGSAFHINDDKTVTEVHADQRWIVSGRTVYNNKNEPCEQYLPYFSDSPTYETQVEIINQGLVPPPTVTHYDALNRVIRVDTPKGFFSKNEYASWQKVHYDEDDTVKESKYYQWFIAHYPQAPSQQQKEEKDALEKAVEFANTPEIDVLDNVGYVFHNIKTLESQRRLIAYSKFDVQGRLEMSIDPRLYALNGSTGSNCFSFLYQYSMGKEAPAISIESSDTTQPEKQLKNIFGDLFWSLSPREYCQLISYDGLQRKVALQVKKLENKDPINSYSDFNLVEKFIYGEVAEAAENSNLRGQLYKLYDLSGLSVNDRYNIQEKLLHSTKQLVVDYKSAVNYNGNNQPKLEAPLEFSNSYNALDNLVIEVTPDESVTHNSYNPAGLLNGIDVTFRGEALTEVVSNIDYYPNGQRAEIVYGNTTSTNYHYEFSTQRLIKIQSFKDGNQSIQDISYTYDPVGNLTSSWNNTYSTIFNGNEEVSPLSSYTYDALYRLTKGNGRQHPGINANTYKNNIASGDFKQSLFSQLPNINNEQKLENYEVVYVYDDSGNLIEKQHKAKSASWNRSMAVEEDSNWLKDVDFDASGNQRQLDINNAVSLSFNCCENLVKASVIERPDELDDADYYVYDSEELRTRKVVERFASSGGVTLIEETSYFDNYEVKKTKSINSEGEIKVVEERQALRVMDDKNCVLINHFICAGSKAGTRSLRFQLSNSLGSISSEYNESGSLISYEEYFPYGGTALIAGASKLQVKQKVYRYSGKERDDSTGLYYYGARYYAPWLARWTKPDPAGTVDGLNLYAFVRGNPMTFHDVDGLSATSNKYEWEVWSPTSYISPDPGLNLILENFGDPTTSVVQVYDDLASRVGYDISHGGTLTSSTESDLRLMFDATKPLHLGFNDLLGDSWRGNLNNYHGSKTMNNLYPVMRSKTTGFFREISSIPGYHSLNDVLYAVSNRPPEVHHVLYKSVRPQYANQTSNLMLVQRSERESDYGPGQHELMHMVGSGNSSNKFSVLSTEFERVYIDWYETEMNVTTMQVSSTM